jgi:HTH-type transcriptional regulator/antitoxin HigA
VRVDRIIARGGLVNIHPIRSRADYERGLFEIKRLWNARPGTEDADKLETLGVLVEEYEKRVYPLPNPDPERRAVPVHR